MLRPALSGCLAAGLLLCGALACAPEEDAPSPPFSGPPGELVRAHSHNDYEQPRPLEDALDVRFYSVEADLWLVEGEVLVSHRPWDYAGRLTTLYLDPLQERVDTFGSVHGDGVGFYLWLDFKDSSPELRLVLYELLEGYDMLTRFTPEGVTPGPVTAILSGRDEQKRAFVQEHPRRRATRDEHEILAEDPGMDADFGYYALDWTVAVGWDGGGEMPPAERAALEELVQAAHAQERPIRFWNLPDDEAGWSVAAEAGVDFINTDRVQDLAAFLAAR